MCFLLFDYIRRHGRLDILINKPNQYKPKLEIYFFPGNYKVSYVKHVPKILFFPLI